MTKSIYSENQIVTLRAIVNLTMWIAIYGFGLTVWQKRLT